MTTLTPTTSAVRAAGSAAAIPLLASAARRAARAERLAFATVLLACVAFALIRQPCNDIGWHLATARTAFDTGHWPINNTFSHTHPDYPLDQQYPLFQTVLYGIHRIAGWNGLSVLNTAGWLLVFLLFVRWGSPLRRAVWLHLPWMIGLLALQRRMIVRPDLFTMIFLAAELLVIDRYIAALRNTENADPARPLPCHRGAPWLLCLPIIHWAWANSHQLFPLSLAVQGLLISHLALARWAPRIPGLQPVTRGAAVPVLPAVGAFLTSLAASFLTPLGTGIVHVLANTSGSLAHHRGDVQEFAYLWQRPWELQLAIACGIFGVVGLWRMRRSWRLVDVGLWCGSLVMMLSAVRGLVFFGPVSIAIFARSFATDAPAADPAPPARFRAPVLRGATIAVTLLLAANVLFHRWISPPLALGGTQPGLGRSLGDWPDAAVAFLRDNPPPGDMLNLPWSLGSPLIWELPQKPVFVDARLEAYPRDFLVACMAAEHDDAALADLIARYQPGWLIANHRDADVRTRVLNLLATGEWSCVYADTLALILVRESPAAQSYLQHRRLTPDAWKPQDLLDAPQSLRDLQHAAFDQLRADQSAHGAQSSVTTLPDER
ncbi:MAG: hypothetical protein H6816_06035 [Phycisphaerales bacterium]|nr:hypothetical protein [Phycisphaerales bacterium]